MYLIHVFKGNPASRSKPGKSLCHGQIGKNCRDTFYSPGISPGRSSPAIARSWELAVLWLPGFCIEGFPLVISSEINRKALLH